MSEVYKFNGIPCIENNFIPKNQIYFISNDKLEIYKLIDFTNEISKLKKDLALARECLEFIRSRTKADPLCIEELKVRAARVYDKADLILTQLNKKEGG